MTYQRYCEDLKRFNQPITMSEKEWRIAYAIEEEEHVPFVARTKSTSKHIAPTLENHVSPGVSSKDKKYVNLMDEPVKSTSELLAILENRIKEKKINPPKSDAVKKPQSIEAKEKKAQRTKEWKEKRAQEFLAMGLTRAGKERVPRKPGLSIEETKRNRALNVKKKRDAFKAQGLTTRGLPKKEKKPAPPIEEVRAVRLKYAKTWREKNKEAHLEYRKKVYYKKKDQSINNTPLSQKAS